MAATLNRRTQAMFRLPVDQQSATMTLHDGTTSEVELFVTGGDSIARMLTDGPQFIPMIRRSNVSLVARSAIACLAVAVVESAVTTEPDQPLERQKAHVHLKSGVVIEGELRWGSAADRKRPADHLNDAATYVVVFAPTVTHYVVKAHIAVVEEK